VHEIQADYRRPTHVLEHKGLWRCCACFYRQVLLFQKEGMWRLLADKWHKCATASSSTFLDTSTVQIRGDFMAKPRTERSLLFPSKEFREQVRKASKDRGFDPNRRSFSPLANARFAGAITPKP